MKSRCPNPMKKLSRQMQAIWKMRRMNADHDWKRKITYRMISPFSNIHFNLMLYEQYKAEYFVACVDSCAKICTTNKWVFPINIEEDIR